MAAHDGASPASRGRSLASSIGLILMSLVLLFLPAGSIGWRPGWIFLGVLTFAFTVAALVLARVNPGIFQARSRFQPGTKGWDKTLLAILLPAIVAILPVAALDAGRFHWSAPPVWLMVVAYAPLLAGIALTAWAQAVNPFFEPGVRIQSERDHHVIDTGPYRYVRHPGYASALLMFIGMPLALGSLWALAPAAVAAALLALRTLWEDRLLRAELPDYPDFSRRVRFRLIPGVW
ncbi:methyltransferase family protein [Phenylobacterium sp.]|uniref:methyltransferase family protein n=1 Tax=Phenylobacterium sp. TaxID=1871053 RepID=UPI0039833EEC